MCGVENGSTNCIRVPEKQIIFRLVPMLEESTGIVALRAFGFRLDLNGWWGDMVVDKCYG